MKAKKSMQFKSGKWFTLIILEADITIERLCELFGPNTIKINYKENNLYAIEALYGNIYYFSQTEHMGDLDWQNIEI